MKLKRSVHGKIFSGCMIFLIANVLSFFLWVIGIKEVKSRFMIGCGVVFFLSIVLDEEINTAPYDEYDNDNIIFFVIFLFEVFILIGQMLLLS